MAFKIIRSDITWADADAIVVAANELLSLDAGTSRAVAMAAGYESMSAACRAIGWCEPGKAVVTPAFDLYTKCVIHAVSPAWSDGCDEDIRLLESAYDAAFQTAVEQGCSSVALPLLGSGNLLWPADISLDIAVERAKLFLLEHEISITLVLYDEEAYEAGSQRFPEIVSYIESARAIPDNSARPALATDPASRAQRSVATAPATQGNRKRRFGLWARIRERIEAAKLESKPADEIDSWDDFPALEPPYIGAAPRSMDSAAMPTAAMPAAMAIPKPASIDEWLAHKDAGFTETLLELIDQRGLEDAEVYKRANMSRQHFSKMRSNPDYRPKKATALALCVALELDLEATKDLLARAGLALNPSDTFDLIVQYHIVSGIYDSFAINEVLFAFDCKLLG